jgi:hypothetical protein
LAALPARLLLATLLVVAGTTAAGADAGTTVRGCGAHDLPETGVQGDVPKADQDSGRAKKGYNCGLALVGHTTLGAGGRVPDANANMAWSGSCAYVASGGLKFSNRTDAITGNTNDPNDNVAIVDVRDPQHPRHTGNLRSAGAVGTVETIAARTTRDRAVLVVGEYGNASVDQPLDIYDVRDCRHPKLLSTFRWPANAHNLAVSADARYVYATLPVQVLDIDPLFATPQGKPRYIGEIDGSIGGTGEGGPNGHEVYPVGDGTTIWTGMQTVDAEAMYAIDLRDWLAHDGAAGHPPVVLSTERSYPGHSVRQATLHGHRYAVHSDESVFGTAYSCLPEAATPFGGVAEPYLSDYTDPRHPVMGVSRLHLAINDPLNCPTALASKVNASSHYQDVDDPDDTHFVMVSMWNAGVRVFDVRDPKAPREVAYFNPGDVGGPGRVLLDQAWGHIRYLPATGQLWFATKSGGFWVVELEPQVRRELGLTAAAGALHPLGFPARADVRLAAHQQLDLPVCKVAGTSQAPRLRR